MRVLIINSVCGIRSTGRIAADIAERYINEGNEAAIAYGREDVPEKYKNISKRITSKTGNYVAGVKARLFDNEGFNAKRATGKFLKWADEYDPDVLWLHNLHGYYINVELLFNWIKSRPDMEVKWTLHDCWAFTGHCSYFSFVKCNKWKEAEGCRNCPQKKGYPSSFLLDRCAANFRKKRKLFTGVKKMTLITPSYWLSDLVEMSYLKEYHVEVVHNTIDTESFKPRKSDFKNKNSIENKKIVLGVAAIWEARKGLQDFIKLSELLDNNKYKIVLVGLTQEQIKLLPDNILGIERTNSKVELAEIYTASDVFVNPTYEDNYPTTNLEAQACGTKCITYRTGGSVESVSENMVVETGNVDALAKKIVEVIG